MSFNSFSAVVRVISDIETKTIKTQQLAKCNGVHNTSYKDDSGMFTTLNFWGSKGAAAEKIIKNGDTIFIKGSLTANTVESGKTYLSVNVDDFSVVRNNSAQGEKTKAKVVKEGKKTEGVALEDGDEIPF